MHKFIVLEGLDGSGKTSQASRLHKHFADKGINCLLTYEPTNEMLGNIARSVTKSNVKMDNETLALLFAADRHEHYVKKIAPTLAAGGMVVCDRYYYSNIVYQGFDEKSIQRIFDYNQKVMQTPPHVVFFLDEKPDECHKRLMSSRSETSIYENMQALTVLYKRYRDLFHRIQKTENIVIVNTTGKNEDDITELLIGNVNR